MKKNREFIYYFVIVLVVAVYLVFVEYSSDVSELSTVVTTVTALIAAVAFWLQLKRGKNLDEANFIMDLNDQFVSNDEMTMIEHALEVHYNQGCEGDLDLVMERTHDDCQRLINYLVYMECLAAMVKKNVMHLGVIDDLFAYHFFIAVNNPVVQEFELFPYADYYKGCFELAEIWTKKWRKEGRMIPLDKFSLCEFDKTLLNTAIKKAEAPYNYLHRD